MKLKSIRLENVGGFSDIEVLTAPTKDLNYNTTVIVGNNGAGKSTILESIATALSWYIARIRSEKGSGSPITELRVKNGTNSAAITIEVENLDATTGWVLAKAQKGKKLDKATKLDDLTKLTNDYRVKFSQDSNISFPVLVFFDANRGVLDIPLKIKGKHKFEQLDGYDNALGGIVDYRRFFEWFREREDAENELKVNFINSADLNSEGISKNIRMLSDNQLDAVRTALEIFLPSFKNFRISRKPRLHMSVEKHGQLLNVEQLSQGEKLTIALVGDIARRLAIMNPLLDNVLLGNGIILIDEAELHLHPRWQRTLVGRLTNAFPNCQFILTTHSPLLISDDKNISIYSLNDGMLEPMDSQFGNDVNDVLLGVMNTDVRNAEVDKTIDDLLNFLNEKKIEEAKSLLGELEKELSENHIEVVKSKLLIKRLELKSNA